MVRVERCVQLQDTSRIGRRIDLHNRGELDVTDGLDVDPVGLGRRAEQVDARRRESRRAAGAVLDRQSVENRRRKLDRVEAGAGDREGHDAPGNGFDNIEMTLAVAVHHHAQTAVVATNVGGNRGRHGSGQKRPRLETFQHRMRHTTGTTIGLHRDSFLQKSV